MFRCHKKQHQSIETNRQDRHVDPSLQIWGQLNNEQCFFWVVYFCERFWSISALGRRVKKWNRHIAKKGPKEIWPNREAPTSRNKKWSSVFIFLLILTLKIFLQFVGKFPVRREECGPFSGSIFEMGFAFPRIFIKFILTIFFAKCFLAFYL